VDYDHVSDSFTHRIGFVALADLKVRVADFYGIGVGYYNEYGVHNPTGCSVTRTGYLTMQVKAQVENREIDMHFVGDVHRQGDAGCAANVGDGTHPDVACVFRDVDFENGGHYVAQDYEGELNDRVWHERCYLELGPMKWPSGRPVRPGGA
jgi:hypothetical protein